MMFSRLTVQVATADFKIHFGLAFGNGSSYVEESNRVQNVDSIFHSVFWGSQDLSWCKQHSSLGR